MNSNWRRLALVVFTLVASSFVSKAFATTSEYPEKVIRWKVESGESCADIAEAVYGSGRHKNLVRRYNNVPCGGGSPLVPGQVLVLPQSVTDLPAAVITYVNPDTRARRAGGAWAEAKSGQNLKERSEVNTHEAGMAAIQFADATRIFLNEHTLVVVYDTAASSAPLSSPPKVHLKSGELSAGLSALGGRAVNVSLPDNASVKLNSSDTAVRRDERKVNVSVFDGSAQVKSAGKIVRVPKNYGSKVVHKKPPEKPRPLPPAPRWGAGFRSILFANSGEGTLQASWSEVAGAKLYRVEVATSKDFQELVVRETVPASVRRLRAEKFPAGEYYIRVRAIDEEDFLGISSSIRRLILLSWRWEKGFGAVSEKGVESNPYSKLALGPSSSLSLRMDDGLEVELPVELDFERLAPEKLELSEGEGGESLIVPVKLLPLSAKMKIDRLSEGQIRASGEVGVETLEGIRATLVVRADSDEPVEERTVSLSGGEFDEVFSIPKGATVVVELRDEKGTRLSTERNVPDRVERPQKVERKPHEYTGVWLGSASSRLTRGAFAPVMARRVELRTRLHQASLGSVWGSGVRVTGNIASWSAEADMDLFNLPRSRESELGAQLGLGYRLMTTRSVDWSPLVRVRFPVESTVNSSEGEFGLAFGSAYENFSWAGNLAARLPFDRSVVGRQGEQAAGHFLWVGAVQVVPIFELATQLDVNLLVRRRGRALVRGGWGVAATLGRTWFASVGARVAPFDDVGEGYVTGQLSLGYRGP